MIALVVVVALRILWQVRPRLLTCMFFWAAVALSQAINPPQHPWDAILLFAGMGCNALVTLANGGTMPASAGGASSLWVTSTKSHRFLLLSDIMPLWASRFSIGDVFIVTAIAAGAMSI